MRRLSVSFATFRIICCPFLVFGAGAKPGAVEQARTAVAETCGAGLNRPVLRLFLKRFQRLTGHKKPGFESRFLYTASVGDSIYRGRVESAKPTPAARKLSGRCR